MLVLTWRSSSAFLAEARSAFSKQNKKQKKSLPFGLAEPHLPCLPKRTSPTRSKTKASVWIHKPKGI